ncbi:MAG: aspartate aminotransferase family protein [Myxococcota bacterium]|nr:aspartate aminotransferase family protein [Myxococcota bacterium]
MDAERASLYPFVGPPGNVPLRIARAEGVWLHTADGARILDAAGGAVLANVGHGRREVAEAYARAATQESYVVPPFATESRVRLVERLRASWLPDGITRAVFTCGGSESMDAAIRLARQHHVSAGRPERWKVIGRDLSYHGTTLATLAIGGHQKRRQPFEPWLAPLTKAPACYCLRCPLEARYPECGVGCADALEAVLEREGPDTVAAFVAEPVVGSTAGALVPPDEYWPRVAEICRRHGVLLVADEVMTGFGRTGRRFGVEHFGVVPDVLVSGKGLAGGYAPMGGVFAREEVIEPIARQGDDLMFYTFSAHPASCAAADAVLDILERERLVERAALMGEKLRKRLSVLESHPHVAEVRGRGLLQAVEIVRDRDTLEPFPKEARITAKVVGAGLGNGVFFYPGGCDPARDVIVLGPPFVIEEPELDRIAEVLRASIDSAVARALE